MQVDDFAAFGFEPRGGYADGYQTAAAFAAAARREGVQVDQGCEVKELTTCGDRVTGVLTADGARVSADCVVVAAGPWSSDLVKDLGSSSPCGPSGNNS